MAMQRYDAAIAGLGGVSRRPVMRKSATGEYVKLSDVLAAIDLAVEIQEEMDYKLGLVNTSALILITAKEKL